MMHKVAARSPNGRLKRLIDAEKLVQETITDIKTVRTQQKMLRLNPLESWIPIQTFHGA